MGQPARLQRPETSGRRIASEFQFLTAQGRGTFGFEYHGYVKIPSDGVYIFYTASDDGSRLYVGHKLVVDNDGLHGLAERKGALALARGCHPIRVYYFEKTGGDELKVSYKGPGFDKTVIPDSALFPKIISEMLQGEKIS